MQANIFEECVIGKTLWVASDKPYLEEIFEDRPDDTGKTYRARCRQLYDGSLEIRVSWSLASAIVPKGKWKKL